MHWSQSAEAITLIARALSVSAEYVLRYCVDPQGFGVPVETLLSDAFLDSQAHLLTGSFPTQDLTPEYRYPVAAPSTSAGTGDPLNTDSNHITIVDQEGNWLTMLHTVFGTPFGTGLVVDGISVNSGNITYFGGTSEGTARRITTPLPPIFAMRDGKPWLGLGSPGASCHTVALVLLNLLHYGMDLGAAVDAPRFQLHPTAGWNGWRIGTLAVETRIPQATLDALARYGVNIAPLGDYNWHMGSIQAVMRDAESGQLLGTADPRRAGHAAGY
jgi:gamma-glutamyltranspeptidase/glutathione hydrolase